MPLDCETADAVLGRFGLASVTGPVLAVARGAMGEISRVDTGAGPYAVKELFVWNPGAGVEREVAFTARARGSGLRIPLEMRSSAGEFIVTVDERRFRIYEWFDVSQVLTPPVDRTAAALVGRTIATLHRLARSSSEKLESWYTTPPAAHRWRDWLGGALRQGKTWAPALAQALPSIDALAELAGEDRGAGVCVCHRDLLPGNMPPLPDQELAVLDWENLGPLEPEQEIGYALVSWCTDGTTLEASAVQALLAGYGTVIDQPARLRQSSFATAAMTWLNLLAVQVEGLLEEGQDPVHREFGESCARAMLSAPLSVGLIDDIVAAAR